MTPKILIRLEDVNVTLNGQPVLQRISWQLREKENWAVLGANGSGKSTFLKLVRGDIWPDPPAPTETVHPLTLTLSPSDGEREFQKRAEGKRRIYSFDSEEQESPIGIRERIAMVSPEMQERYLQQDWSLTGENVIHTGFFSNDLLYQRPDRTQKIFADALIERLRLGSLRRKQAQEMSTGELRKILIARALVGQPRILILDEFCDGLDVETRDRLLVTVEEIARSGTQILYTTHRPEEIVPSITHVLTLEGGKILQPKRREDLWLTAPSPGVRGTRVGVQGAMGEPMIGQPLTLTLSPSQNGRGNSRTSQKRNRGREEAEAQTEKQASVRLVTSAATGTQSFFVRIENADVFLGRRKVLRGINWQMNADENWAVLGKNGAGKSTFLKLIFGDVQPALGGSVRWFNTATAHSLWRTKARIGYVSADFQANYREEISGKMVVASGFFSSVGLMENPSRHQMARVRALLRRFEIGALADKNILEMSYGQLRKFLVLRALVNDPALLLLDEPFDGLDAAAQTEFGDVLEQICRNRTRLVVVTHHWRDLPRCMTHALVLESGRIYSQGRLA